MLIHHGLALFAPKQFKNKDGEQFTNRGLMHLLIDFKDNFAAQSKAHWRKIMLIHHGLA
jgi:hypothetical protein